MASSFESTHWTVIDQARHPDEVVRRMALERIAKAYYPPMISYLTRLMGPHGEDCLQEFMQAKFLNGFFDREWNRKERFRNYLKKCLRNFAMDFFRKLNRKSDSPNRSEGLPEDLADVSAPDLFDLDWARNVLQESIQAMHQQCSSSEEGEKVWQVFLARTLQPCLQRERPEAYAELNARLGFTDPRAGDAALAKGKRLFSKILSETLARYAANKHEVRSEFRDLLAIVENAQGAFQLDIPRHENDPDGECGDEQIDAQGLISGAQDDIRRISDALDRELWESLMHLRMSEWLSQESHIEAIGDWSRHSLASALLSPNTPLVVFKAIRLQCAALKRFDSSHAAQLELLRCLAIAAAVVRHDKLIAQTPVPVLYATLLKLSEDGWYGEHYRPLLLEAVGRLSRLAR